MVTIRDFHFAYRRKPVFTGLNLELKPGYIYGLLGRNGTGKSTLLRNLAGFLFPKKGQLEVMGFTPGKRLPAFLQQVFLVPEEFYLPAISIESWVQYHSPFYKAFDKEMFHRTILEFGIPAAGRLDEMSYGQQKKTLISFALATNASLLLMDEPTNGLDILSKSQFRKIIAGALSEQKCILISTHQVKDLENLIDRVMVIDEGKILFDQTMHQISQKLNFKLSFDAQESAHALYKENSLKGNALILANTEGEETQPDLEMLYKAIVLNGKEVNELFNESEKL